MLVQWVNFIYNIRFNGPGQAQDCAVDHEPCVCDPVRSRNHAVRCFKIFTVSTLYLLVHANIVLLQPDSHPWFWSNCAAPRFFLYPSFFLWASLAASFSSFDCFFRVHFAYGGGSFLSSLDSQEPWSAPFLGAEEINIMVLASSMVTAGEYRMQISLS